MAKRRKPTGQAAKPNNFDQLFAQIGDFITDFKNRYDYVWKTNTHGIEARTEELVPAHFTEERAKVVKTVADDLLWLSKTAEKLSRQSSGVHKLFTEKLAQQMPPLKTISLKTTDEEMWRPGQS